LHVRSSLHNLLHLRLSVPIDNTTKSLSVTHAAPQCTHDFTISITAHQIWYCSSVAVCCSALQFVAMCCNMLWFAYPNFCQPTESSTTAVSVTVRVAQSSVGPWEMNKNRNHPWESCRVLDAVVVALVVCFQRVKHLYLIRLVRQHSSLLFWNFRICLRDCITYSTSMFVDLLTRTTLQGARVRQAKNYKKSVSKGSRRSNREAGEDREDKHGDNGKYVSEGKERKSKRRRKMHSRASSVRTLSFEN